MARKSFSTKERTRLFALNKGICHICSGKIDASLDAWEIEHVNPLAMTGDNSDDNLKLAHQKCHAIKTKQDVALIAEAKRHLQSLPLKSSRNASNENLLPVSATYSVALLAKVRAHDR
jgi:5-methylcytosine-specific restriction endonuclease McrA